MTYVTCPSLPFSSRSGGAWAPHPHLRPQIIFWGPNYTFLHLTRKFSKYFCLASLRILFKFSIDIFWSKTENYSFLRPQIIFWGPNYTFLHLNNTKFSKKICLTSFGILFKFSIDIFWSKTLENYSFLRSQIIFWGPNYTFLHLNNTKFSKKFCLTSLSILFKFSIDIFWSKTLENYSCLRPQIILWGPNLTFYSQITQKFSNFFCLTLLSILAYLNSQLKYFDQKTF